MRKTGPTTWPTPPSAPRLQRQQQKKTFNDTPPEDVKAYVDIMGWLVETEHLASEESDRNLEEEGREQKQEEERVWEDPDLLSYIDKLCSEDCI
jgi:hypothetical protein